MNTTELYIKVLKKIRFGELSKETLSLSDFVPDSNEYKFVAQYNEAMNLLSDLISIMEVDLENNL